MDNVDSKLNFGGDPGNILHAVDTTSRPIEHNNT